MGYNGINIHQQLNPVTSRDFGKDMCSFVFHKPVKMTNELKVSKFPIFEIFSDFLCIQTYNSVLSTLLNQAFALKSG